MTWAKSESDNVKPPAQELSAFVCVSLWCVTITRRVRKANHSYLWSLLNCVSFDWKTSVESVVVVVVGCLWISSRFQVKHNNNSTAHTNESENILYYISRINVGAAVGAVAFVKRFAYVCVCVHCTVMQSSEWHNWNIANYTQTRLTLTLTHIRRFACI